MIFRNLIVACFCVMACSPVVASISGEDCIRIVEDHSMVERGEWIVLAESGQPLIAQTNALWYNEYGVPSRISRLYQCKDLSTYRRVYTEREGGAGVGPWRNTEE